MKLNEQIDFSSITKKTWTREQFFKIFCGIMLGGICFYILTLFISGFQHWNGFLFSDLEAPEDHFMDFFNPISYSASFDAAYTYWHVIYPPLPTAVCTFLATFFPPELLNNFRAFGLRSTTLGISMLITFFLLSFIGLFILLYRMKEGTKKVKIIFCILILFSFPFIFWFERANNIIFAVIASLFFVAFYNSQKNTLKHFALFALALSINIKVYPAVFGMLLLREKRFKDILYLGLYTVILFFMPFLFVGHINSLSSYFYSLTRHTNWSNNLCCGFGTSLPNVMETCFTAITALRPSQTLFKIFSNISLFIGFFGVFASYYIKDFWKVCALLSLLIILIPQSSGDYCLLFMLIPLISFLNKTESNFRDLIYLVLFAIVFMLNIPARAPILSNPHPHANPISINNLLAKLSCTIMFIMLCYDGAKYFLKVKRMKK